MWGAKVTEAGFAKAREALSMESSGMRVGMAALRGMQRLVPVDTFALRAGAYAGPMEVTYSRGPASSYASYVYGKRDKAHARTPGTTLDWPGAYESSGAREVVDEMVRVINECD